MSFFKTFILIQKNFPHLKILSYFERRKFHQWGRFHREDKVEPGHKSLWLQMIRQNSA